jgi:hypothetical protein
MISLALDNIHLFGRILLSIFSLSSLQGHSPSKTPAGEGRLMSKMYQAHGLDGNMEYFGST